MQRQKKIEINLPNKIKAMKQLSFLLLLMIHFSFYVNAQNTTINNMQRSALQTSDVIKQGSEVKGYYFFYISDKIDRRTNQYTLRIMDNNLNVLKDITFEDSKGVTVLEASFNGTDLLFLFYNEEERTFDYQLYGADGKKKPYTYSRILGKRENLYIQEFYQNFRDDERSFKGIYPVDEKGFISNTPSLDDGHFSFQVNYFSSEKKKQWSFTPLDDAKRIIGDYLGQSKNIVYLSTLKYKSSFSGNPESTIIGLDLETGKMLFEKPTYGKFRFSPSSISVLNGQVYIYGEYYNSDDNIVKDHSLGLAIWSLDNKGKIITEKYNSWENDLSKYLSVSSKGKIEDFGYLFLHNMIQTPDGNIYAIGEGYKRVASGLGIALKVMGGNTSVTKFQITDLAVINFDKDFNLKGVKIYPKTETNIEMSSQFDFVSVSLLGKHIKYTMGGFDYRYVQANGDNSNFSICYSDFEKTKDYKGGTFKSISFNNGKFTEDRIATKSAASSSWVLPGKLGQVLLIDYYKKEKRLEAHFEKLN
jgi:hypothetical protein